MCQPLVFCQKQVFLCRLICLVADCHKYWYGDSLHYLALNYLVTWESATKHTLNIEILVSGRRLVADIHSTANLKGNWLANQQHFTFYLSWLVIRLGIAQAASILPESLVPGLPCLSLVSLVRVSTLWVLDSLTSALWVDLGQLHPPNKNTLMETYSCCSKNLPRIKTWRC